jgi:hypothetical protein
MGGGTGAKGGGGMSELSFAGKLGSWKGERG